MSHTNAAGQTHVGRVRDANEDSIFIGDRVWVVADGMGGHAAGEVASNITIETIRALDASADTDLDEEILVQAVADANRAVYNASEADGARRGMGTTVVALALLDTPSTRRADDDPDQGDGTDQPASAPPLPTGPDTSGVRLVAANVGDSRLYRLSGGELTQISVDHKVVQDLVALGELTQDEAAHHPKRNMLSRAIGVDPTVEVDHWQIDAYRGDRFLLCSDGLTDEVTDGRIAATLRRLADPSDAAAELVRQALDAGGRDNVTVLVVDVTSDDGALDAATASTPPSAGRRHPPSPATSTPGPSAVTRPDPAPTPAPTAPTTPRQPPWVAFAVAAGVIAVLVVGFAAVAIYARGAYTVTVRDDTDVVILRGRPDGVLWFDPTLEEDRPEDLDDFPEATQRDLIDGAVFSSLDDARAFIDAETARAARQRRLAGADADPIDDAPATTDTGSTDTTDAAGDTPTDTTP